MMRHATAMAPVGCVAEARLRDEFGTVMAQTSRPGRADEANMDYRELAPHTYTHTSGCAGGGGAPPHDQGIVCGGTQATGSVAVDTGDWSDAGEAHPSADGQVQGFVRAALIPGCASGR